MCYKLLELRHPECISQRKGPMLDCPSMMCFDPFCKSRNHRQCIPRMILAHKQYCISLKRDQNQGYMHIGYTFHSQVRLLKYVLLLSKKKVKGLMVHLSQRDCYSNPPKVHLKQASNKTRKGKVLRWRSFYVYEITIFIAFSIISQKQTVFLRQSSQVFSQMPSTEQKQNMYIEDIDDETDIIAWNICLKCEKINFGKKFSFLKTRELKNIKIKQAQFIKTYTYSKQNYRF